MVTFTLLVIGGLDWLLYALGYEVVHYLGSTLSMVVYVLVGLSALYEVFTHKANCKVCGTPGGQV
ncbi:MAG: DUF378 domain-containing protein [Candidatus Colwellbacteria bacterium CG_4_9_14_0_2_um_filter_50_12]|uniref:DUF378 domain-containing protein n=1 Tax=Candidatus Colwellbacteria bacterium CG_4_9_14_0_2_um_filter_50_12 TaxID=1974538 RepID=A0A2M8G178_9BACT|nr:MAG: DUF378 domain-containing protein [Candidatus Colwellbacteria bacterium CG_4_9_14_0_2_um_filter_50_12]